jgi:hypothetical protein
VCSHDEGRRGTDMDLDFGNPDWALAEAFVRDLAADSGD